VGAGRNFVKEVEDFPKPKIEKKNNLWEDIIKKRTAKGSACIISACKKKTK